MSEKGSGLGFAEQQLLSPESLYSHGKKPDEARRLAALGFADPSNNLAGTSALRISPSFST